MSLINEALKKAQARQGGSARPADSGNIPPMQPGGMPPRKSFPNWYVLSALVILFGISVAGAGWLIAWGFQSDKSDELVEGKQAQTSSESMSTDRADTLDPISFKAPTEEIPKEITPAGNPPEEPMASAESQRPPEPRVEETVKAVSNVSSEAPSQSPREALPSSLPEEVAESPSRETSNLRGETASADPEKADSEPLETQEKPQPIAQKTVQEFLTKLQIRGIMSGGIKVLIFHPELGRTLAYKNGEELRGDLQIKIHNVYKDRVAFIDDGGFIYIKRF